MTSVAVLLLALAAAPAAERPVPLPPPPAGASASATPRARPASAKPRLAILDFSLAGSAHPDLARVLSDGAARGAEVGEVQVITQGEVAAVLGLDRMRQLLGCSDDQGCMADVAGALDAERLLSGSLTILDRTALLTVRLIDARKGRTLARTTASLKDATEQELVDAARRLAHEAVTGKRLDTTGRLKLAVDRPGASVTLDGKEIGPSPLREAPRVLEGPHAVVVQKPGYVRWSSTVTVPAGGEAPVDVQLVPIRLMGEQARSRLWSWGFVSAGVAVAATGSGILWGKLASDSYDRYKTATNRSQAVSYRDDTRTRSTLANVSWGVAGVSAVGAGVLFVSAMRADARAAEAPVAVVPLPNGLALAGTF